MVQKSMVNEMKQVTGIRGIMAFLIAYVLHWALLFGAVPEFDNLYIENLFGASGPLIFLSPNLFFLLSGYLIHKSNKERIENKKISWKNFIFPKVKKMYPMVIVTACLVFVMQNIGKIMYGQYFLHADGGEIRYSIFALLLSFVGMQSGYFSDNDTLSVNGPAWFISVLFLCYTIYFFSTSLPKNVYLKRIVYFVMVILGGVLIINAPNFPFLYSVNGRGYFSFFGGVLIRELVVYIDCIDSAILQKNINRSIYVFSLLSCAASFYLCCINTNDIPHEAFVLAVLFWPSLMYIVIHGYVLRHILSLNIFILLGKVSMPIFLCNFPTDILIRLVDVVFKLNLDYKNPWLWGGHVIISLLIAIGFHMIFEKVYKVRWTEKLVSFK